MSEHARDVAGAGGPAEQGFEALGLSAPLLAGVRAAGFTAPRPIQARALPAALAGRDVLGLARTGTGKTAAFALPLLEAVGRREPGPAPVALVLAPTRELATQIAAECERLGSALAPRVALLIGGVKSAAQEVRLAAGADVVVATVGRLLDHLRSGALSLDDVETLVLDEADRMVDMGFLPDVQRVLDRLPAERQTMMVSATMPESVQALAQRRLREPEIIDLGHTMPAESI
ncbi:MAG: DEAD/DEAH box helicase, partial [Planctomycetota bacterium]|nr:DEAD/DEAH box helicase [Planctomycetota bacterium]